VSFLLFSAPKKRKLMAEIRKVGEQNMRVLNEILGTVRENSQKIAQLETDVKSLNNFVYARSRRAHESGPLRTEGQHVVLGDDIDTVAVPRNVYQAARGQIQTGKALILKMLDPSFGVYTQAELAERNWNGGNVKGKDREGNEEEQQKISLIKEVRFRALLAQTKREFPGVVDYQGSLQSLTACVNNKCRKTRHRNQPAPAEQN
jgi:hypothetical protein